MRHTIDIRACLKQIFRILFMSDFFINNFNNSFLLFHYIIVLWLKIDTNIYTLTGHKDIIYITFN